MGLIKDVIGMAFAHKGLNALKKKAERDKAVTERDKAEKDSNNLTNLRKLQDLYDDGIITDEEFERKRRQIMRELEHE